MSELRLRLNPNLHPGHKQCLKGTRAEFLKNVVLSMLNNSIVLIHGRAGTGKSCIAGSLAHIIHIKDHSQLDNVELAMSFHCIRENRDQDVSMLVPTLAYQLALEFPALGTILASNPGLDIAGDLSIQFENLLFVPLKALKKERNLLISKKIAIIVDGLDEWGQEEDRVLLLTKLQSLCRDHDWMRFIITSRPNSEIAASNFPGYPGLFKRIDLSEDEETVNDIETFVRHYRSNNSKLSKALSELEILSLLPYISSLFILADVVCKFIAQNPRHNFEILKNERSGFKSGRNSYDVLCKLYETVLEECLEDPSNNYHHT